MSLRRDTHVCGAQALQPTVWGEGPAFGLGRSLAGTGIQMSPTLGISCDMMQVSTMFCLSLVQLSCLIHPGPCGKGTFVPTAWVHAKAMREGKA